VPCLYVPENLLSGITPTNETADTGYSLANLTDDVVAKAFRTSTTLTSTSPTVDRTSATPTPITWVGVFDVQCVTATESVRYILVEDSPDNTNWTEVGRFTLNSRGDGGRIVNSTQRYIKYSVSTTGSTKIDIGLLFGGVFGLFPKTFTRRQQSKDRGVVVNDTEGGGTYTGRLRSYRHVLSLGWSVLDETQHNFIQTLEDNVEGQYSPFVLVPDSTRPAELYHGRLEDVQTYTQNPGGLYDGHALAFRESGRAL
jgi:hypothetical protein